MILTFAPQVRFDSQVWYSFEGEKIQVTIDGKTDTFNFSNFPDGELKLHSNDGELLVKTLLDEVPILSAHRHEGELYVKMLLTLSEERADEGNLPELSDPMSVGEAQELMDKKWDGEGELEYVEQDSRAEMVWIDSEEVLGEEKAYAKDVLSSDCQQSILSGFECEIDGEVYHFSYDKESQSNIQERWQLFQNNMVSEMTITAHQGDKDVRLTVDKEVFDQIYIASVQTKESKISKLRDELYPLVDEAGSISELSEVAWDPEVDSVGVNEVGLKKDKLLNDELKRVELSNAASSAETMGLIMMMQMGL